MAADARFDSLREALGAIGRQSLNDGGPRGASPILTVAKHQLRDWVESRLGAGDPEELARSLNAELDAAQLFCASQCVDEVAFFGTVHELQIRRSGAYLTLVAGVGILCGFDDSAYVYRSTAQGWRRVWQSEQNNYLEGAYRPQMIVSVQVSLRADMVLTLGREPWCTSWWHDVYYRVFRLGSEGRPLIDGSSWAYVPEDPPIRGRFDEDRVLVEFTVASLDPGIHSRKKVVNYKIDGNRVSRVDPLALSPRDFVEEWVGTKWNQVSQWTEQQSFRGWHEQHRGTLTFVYSTMRCRGSADLWQVKSGIGKADVGTYFLVRRTPPYVFRMVRVSQWADPSCVIPDPGVNQHGTLIP